MSKEDKVVVDIFGGCCGRKVGEESGRDGGLYRERLSEPTKSSQKHLTFEGKTSIRSNVAIYIAKQVPFHH